MMNESRIARRVGIVVGDEIKYVSVSISAITSRLLKKTEKTRSVQVRMVGRLTAILFNAPIPSFLASNVPVSRSSVCLKKDISGFAVHSRCFDLLFICISHNFMILHQDCRCLLQEAQALNWTQFVQASMQFIIGGSSIVVLLCSR